MLTTADNEALAGASQEAMRKLENDMLKVMCKQLSKMDTLDQTDVNRAMIELFPKLQKLTARHLPNISEAVRRDITGAFIVSAMREYNYLKNAPEWSTSAQDAISAASSGAEATVAEVLPVVQSLVAGMPMQAWNSYLRACDNARIGANIKGERAMAEAVQQLARDGVPFYSYSYTRNGKLVTANVPVDVGIRRTVVNAGKNRMITQTLEMAALSKWGLVEVSTTANCRESHATWQGKRYSAQGQKTIDGKLYEDFATACRLGDRRDGIGGYNCGHQAAVCAPDEPSRFKDPLAGKVNPATGEQYTLDESRAAYGRQRALENEIRKQKRAVEALKENGYDTRDANRQLNNLRRQLREHLDQNSTLLTRSRSREQIYDSARRMANAEKKRKK